MFEVPSAAGVEHAAGESRRPSAILVTPMFGGGREADLVGADAYSYHFVYRAFLPLLREIGEVIEVEAPESRLDWAAEQARRRGLDPIHLSFRPLQAVYLSSLLPNVAFPFWEFPHLPDEDFDDNPRNNWARIAGRLSLVLCASDFTRDAFRRAGVSTPVRTVPVPIRAECFALPSWDAGGAARLRCETRLLGAAPAADGEAARRPRTLRGRARGFHEGTLRPLLPRWANRAVDATIQTVKGTLGIGEEGVVEAWLAEPALDLSGVVYTTIFNPFDRRKNWRDLLSAFALALGDKEDATLVLKLAVGPENRRDALALIAGHFASFGLRLRCKVALIADYLSEAQMLELMRRSTYYVSATRAEGSCLPAQDFLAAGRPVIAPVHSALADYLGFDVGFPVESHPEPTHWPHDPSRHLRTTRQRIVWQSLHEQLWASHVAARQTAWYEATAERCRARMNDFASAERVRPLLRDALGTLLREPAALR
jgi:glycosyltransferase involved in cell wall biosynthesis